MTPLCVVQATQLTIGSKLIDINLLEGSERTRRRSDQTGAISRDRRPFEHNSHLATLHSPTLPDALGYSPTIPWVQAAQESGSARTSGPQGPQSRAASLCALWRVLLCPPLLVPHLICVLRQLMVETAKRIFVARTLRECALLGLCVSHL